jgi:SAM-dependent methyltransferase
VENDGAPATGHFRLEEVQHKSFWFRVRNRVIQHVVRRLFPSARVVLEIGCGTGFVLAGLRAALPAATLVGSEAYVGALALAAARVAQPANFVQLDARFLPWRDEFDLIGAFDVIEHVTEDEAVLREIYVALKPGGGALFTVPQHKWLWSRADEVACHKRRYEKGEVADKLRNIGFTVVLETSLFMTVLPLMILQRMIWGRRERYDPTKELALPAMIDKVLQLSMFPEEFMLTHGGVLPWGSSQLVAAIRPS